MAQLTHCKAIFAPASPTRRRAVEDFWAYLIERDGALQEGAQWLEHTTAYYQDLQARAVHARRAFTPAPTIAALSDQLATQHRLQTDRRLLTLTLIYKFASREAAGRRIATRKWAPAHAGAAPTGG